MTLTDLTVRPSWHARAACRGADLDLFFAEVGQTVATAKAICNSCPVRTQCLDEALEHHERFGIFGGLSQKERRAEARRRGIPPTPHGQLPPPPCGTSGGYQRHIRTLHDPPCEPCRAAHAAAKAARRNGGCLPDKADPVNHPTMRGPAARWRTT